MDVCFWHDAQYSAQLDEFCFEWFRMAYIVNVIRKVMLIDQLLKALRCAVGC